MRNLLNLQRSSFMQPGLLCSRQLQISSISWASVLLRPASFPWPPQMQHDVPHRQLRDWFGACHHSAGESVFRLWTLQYFKHVYFPRALLLILSTGNWFLHDSHPFIYMYIRALYKLLYLLRWWPYFLGALFVCPDIFLHDKKVICQMALEQNRPSSKSWQRLCFRWLSLFMLTLPKKRHHRCPLNGIVLKCVYSNIQSELQPSISGKRKNSPWRIALHFSDDVWFWGRAAALRPASVAYQLWALGRVFPATSLLRHKAEI